MASNAGTGTMRGTPNRGQPRGGVPSFANSPASNIPRPAFESHPTSASTVQSEAAGSSMSASRQKQSKRDEVSGLS
jgi:hypothetical protein